MGPCPKVYSTRLAHRFLQDDGCGKSYKGVSAIGRVAELKMLHFVTFLIKCKLVQFPDQLLLSFGRAICSKSSHLLQPPRMTT
jgi:hypothetical protein